MKKIITIICSVDKPIKHMLNTIDFDVYEAVGDESIFTMISKDKSTDWKMAGEVIFKTKETTGTNNLGAKEVKEVKKYVYVGDCGCARFFAEVDIYDEYVKKAQTKNAKEVFGKLIMNYKDV